MKKILLLIFVVLLGTMFLTSCKSSSSSSGPSVNDFENLMNPEKYDFAVIVNDADGVMIIPVSLFDEKSDLTLKINGQNVDLEYLWFTYFAEYNFTPGTTYEFELISAKSSYKANLQVPYSVNVTNFPAEFDPTKALTLNWQVAQNNKLQLVEIYYYMNSWDDDEDGEYYKSISPSLRSYTFKANAVPANCDNYDISVVNANYVTSGRVSFIGVTSDEEEYYSYDKKSIDIREKALNIIKKIK